MRTPEEVARTMAKWACPNEDGPCPLCVQDYADLIRARDAEVRAEVLADLTRRASRDKSVQGLQRATICSWLSRQAPTMEEGI